MSPRSCHRLRRALKIFALLLLVFGSGGRSHALDSSALQAMVIVEGDEGRGSGFVVKMAGKTYLVTNSHVIRGNRNVKFKDMRNAQLVTGPLEIADRVDAVRAAVTGGANVLELEPQIEKLKIGDEVVVAGNSEGEGVVREISGKVVGIGPDRIEVDAEFVPGNSGSPILLKSTGKVIGVATYMKVPRGRGGAKSPFSLNEIRRFGYRLDTVTKWVVPQGKDRLLMEGLKLVEMESLLNAITAVLGTNADYVAKWGADRFVSKDDARQYPAFGALALAIDSFAKERAAGTTPDDKAQGATTFFTKLKGIVADDTRGLAENQFSGFYSIQLKESLSHFKEFTDFSEGTAMPAFREAWLTSRAATPSRSGAPQIDPAKFKLVLTDRVVADEPADYCHHVSYPTVSEPSNMEGLFWVIVEPGGAKRAFQMHKTAVRVRTPSDGTYSVYIEFRGGDKPQIVSNVAEFKYPGGQAPVANANPAPPAPPAPRAPRAPTEPPAPPAPPFTFAKAEVEGAKFLPLVASEKIWSDRPVRITRISPAFQGLGFTQQKALGVNLKFKVVSDGLLYLGCTGRWAAKGVPDAAKDLATEQKLQAEGWTRLPKEEVATEETATYYVMFWRRCKAGEEFSYHTDKYVPPILLWK